MSLKIDQDHSRFRAIVRGKIRQNLRKYISQGELGDPIGGDQEEEGEGGRQAGQGAGQHALEVDVTLDELAAILGEELELPDIKDKGKSKIINAKDRYTSIRRVG